MTKCEATKSKKTEGYDLHQCFSKWAKSTPWG